MSALAYSIAAVILLVVVLAFLLWAQKDWPNDPTDWRDEL